MGRVCLRPGVAAGCAAVTACGPAAQGRCISLLPAVSAVSALFIAAAVSSHRRKGPVFSPHLGRTRGVRSPFLPGGIVCPAPQKRDALHGASLFFVITHRFCCLHSRTSQGRGSVRGEPLTGSPTRVQSPARRRPLLRSKSAAPKRKHHPDGWCFLFGAGDEESAEAPPAAEEARRFRGSVLTAGRGSGWEPADTTVSAEEHAKKSPPKWVVIFGAGDEARTRFPASHEWLSPFAGALPHLLI